MKKILLLFIAFNFTYFINAQNFTIEQQAIKKTVVDFYKWYRLNDKKINAFKLYKSKNKNHQPPYVIDWNQAEKYFNYVRKNVPWLGESFIENEKKEFKEIQLEFNKEPDSELPPGFDSDRFTDSQEDAKYTVDNFILNKKNKWEVVIAPNGKNASVFINNNNGTEIQKSKVELVKEKSIWKISKLIRPADVDIPQNKPNL